MLIPQKKKNKTKQNKNKQGENGLLSNLYLYKTNLSNNQPFYMGFFPSFSFQFHFDQIA